MTTQELKTQAKTEPPTDGGPTIERLVRLSLEETRALRVLVIESTQTTAKRLEENTHALGDVVGRVARLEHHVHGSLPPPADPPPGAPRPAPIARELAETSARATGNAHELAALEGRMIAGFSAQAKKTDDLGRELVAMRDELGRELAAQSRDLGLHQRGWAYLTSPRGVRQVQRTLTLVLALVAAASSTRILAPKSETRDTGGVVSRVSTPGTSGSARPAPVVPDRREPTSAPTTPEVIP